VTTSSHFGHSNDRFSIFPAGLILASIIRVWQRGQAGRSMTLGGIAVGRLCSMTRHHVQAGALPNSQSPMGCLGRDGDASSLSPPDEACPSDSVHIIFDFCLTATVTVQHNSPSRQCDRGRGCCGSIRTWAPYVSQTFWQRSDISEPPKYRSPAGGRAQRKPALVLKERLPLGLDPRRPVLIIWV
jgi:hypothetical protein